MLRTKKEGADIPYSLPSPHLLEKSLMGSAAVAAGHVNVPLSRSGLGLEKYSKTVGFLLGGGRIGIMG